MTSSFLALIGDVGGAEMMLIFALVLLLFGGKRLPEFARGLGRSIREFKKATSGVEEEIKRAMEDPPPPRKRPAPLPAPTPVALPAPAPTGVIDPEGMDHPGPLTEPNVTPDPSESADPHFSESDPHQALPAPEAPDSKAPKGNVHGEPHP